MIANRLKKVSGSVTDHSQSSFIVRRSIFLSVLVTNRCLLMKKKKKSVVNNEMNNEKIYDSR